VYNEFCQLFSVIGDKMRLLRPFVRNKQYIHLVKSKKGGNMLKQVCLLFSNEVMLEDERMMKLDYSLTEKYTQENQITPYYGIQIAKYLGDSVETEEITGISYSKDTVVSIIKKLLRYEVTPISMVEIVDDLITEGI
jgi:hypothetical protein